MRNARRLLAALLAVVMLIPSILVPGYAAETTGFKDVREDSWYANAVDYVSAAGYMKGTSKEAFSPGEDVTRAMFVTILSRVARAQTDNTVSAFGDVAANRYYSGAIEWAAEKEIVNGVGGGLFAPYRSITRQDLAVMLYRFVNAMGCELSAGESRTYTDEAAISAYAADAVRFVTSTGLFAGYQDGSFRPKATATRAQTAVIVMRLAQLLDGQIVDPEPMPAQSFDQTSEQMQVSVNAPEGALPENTKMTVSRVTDEAALAELASKVGAEVLGAADISFAKDGAELEPARKVSVRISLDALRSARNPAVVHVKDDGSFEYVSSSVVTTRGKADAIEFEADSFSVYAVVGGEGGSNTLTITFYARENGSTGDWKPINKQILRQDQLTDANNPTPIFDPGVPNISTTESFEGWYLGTASNGSYSESDTGVSVAEINEYWHDTTLTGNIEQHYYAMVYPVLYVVYHDQNGAVLMTESYHKNGSNQASVTINWPYVPFTEGYTFTGWTPDIDERGDEPTYSANPTVYQNGQSYTISATLNLYPYVQEGHWITFDNNLVRNNTVNGFDDPTTASYTAPVFAASGVNPTRPTDPERPGYTFGGWYANSNLSGSQFNFNTPLTADTTLYAKWTPTTNGTSYMVVFWVQSVSDEVNTSDNHKEYDFGYSEIRTGTACSNAALTISNSGTDADNRRGYNNSSSYRSLVITFNQTNTISKNGWSSVNGTKPIRGDGGTVLNVYYDRRAITYIFADGYTTNPYSGAITYTNPRTYSGLYGQPFSEEAFPATGDQFWKCVEQNSTINRYINGFTFFDNTNSTYHFVPNTMTGLKNIYEKTQKLNADGTGVLDEYDLKYTYFVKSNNGASLIDSDTFPGFEGYKYNYSGDNLTGASDFPSTGLTVYGSQITGDGAYLYFNRLAYDLDFNSNGTRVRHETVYFEAPLSRFADYVPDNGPRECFFDGWFSDQQLTQKHNLLTATMPNGTKTVFAKWTPKKYRVILNNVSPSDGVTAPSGAQASFLVNGGERIDKDALECFTCDGKRLMGWYTDPEFKHPFNPESLIYDTVSDVNTYYGEKMPGETDAAYKARMNGATRTDTDSITNTTWDDRWDTDDPDSYAVQRTVRSQLQLYALWRADPDGVVGMHVTYLGDNGNDTGYFDVTVPTVHPHTWKDPDLYSDQSWAYAQPASVPDRPDDRQFLYWEILDDEGQPTGRKVYPGQTFEILFDDAYQGTEPPTNCEHTEREFVAAVAATCETAGNSAHYRCTNCGRRFATNDPLDTTVINPTIPALGHLWEDANKTYSWSSLSNTPVTCTATAVCSRNSAHTLTETAEAVWYVDTPATGHSAGTGPYEASCTNTSVFTAQTSSSVEIPQLTEATVSFSVPTGVASVPDVSAEPGSSITLPSAGAPSGSTFLGWTNAPVSNASSAPSYSASGTGFTVPDEGATLYALYSYTAASYNLLTAAPSDWSGNYVITAGKTESMYVMKNAAVGTDYDNPDSGGHAAFNTTGMSLSSNQLTNVSDSYVFEIGRVTYNNRTYYTLKNRAANAWLNFSTSYVLALQSSVNSGNYWSLSYASGGVKAVSTNGLSSYFVAWDNSIGCFGSLNAFAENYETQFWKETTETKYTTAADAVSINFSVPSGVSAVSSISAIPGSTITLPTAGSITGYTFLGWTEDTLASETTTAPTYASVSNYTVPSSNKNFNALYTRSETKFDLVTSAPSSWTGNYVITAGSDSNMYVLKGMSGYTSYQSSNSGGHATFSASGITLDGSSLKNVTDVYVFVAEIATGSYYTLKNKSTGTWLMYYYNTLYSYNDDSGQYSYWTLGYNTSSSYTTAVPYSSNSRLSWQGSYFYVNSNQNSTRKIQFWKQSSGTYYYTGSASGTSAVIGETESIGDAGLTELDLVSYNPSNPVRDGEPATEYNIFLRAVYGPYNPDATTHIYWYANNGTNAHNGAGERYISKYKVTEGGTTTTTTKLPINAQVDIPLPTGNPASQTVFVGDNNGTLTWEDHVFLGWARVDNGGSADEAQAQILTPDDIYLKWTGTEYEVRNDDGTYSPFSSQKVYADETTPYHDMYAVWAGFYYIYHSSDGSLEAVQVPFDASETKDLVAEAESKNCLYGGYYTGTGAVAAVTAAQMRTAKNAVINAADFWNYATGTAKADASTSLLDAGAVVYNGESIKHTVAGATVQFWNKAQAYGFGAQADAPSGDQMTPVAGAVYYLKEVPKTFLPNRLVYVKADKNTQLYDGTQIEEGKLTSLYLLTAVDDRNYAENGFMVGTAHSGQTVTFPDGNNGSADTVSRVFTIFVKNGETYSYNANALNPSIGVPQGMNPNLVGFVAAKHLDYEWILAHKGQTDGSNVTFYLKPYWTTLDGVTVTQDNIKGVNITADGKGISFVNVQ